MKKVEEMVQKKRATFELLVDSDRFWNRLKADIASASRNVYIQTLSFEGDRVGKTLADEMLASPAPDKRIIVDHYTNYILSDKFLYSPKNWFDTDLRREVQATHDMIAGLRADGTRVRFVNPFGFMFRHLPSRNHKKIIVVDDRISYIGGINFSDHNFQWHDMMLRIDDEQVADYLRKDFLTSWEGRHFGGRRQFDRIELFAFDGKTNERAFEPILDFIDDAEKTIYVQSPYLCHPFIDHLRQAVGRGVAVTLVSPEKNNKKALRGYIRYEAARSGFDLRLYERGMTHLKAMLIDDRRLIIGSSNFDYFSYRFEQETVAVITDDDIIAAFIENVVNFDEGCCRKIDRPRKTPSGYLRYLEVHAVAALAGWFNGRH
jgi:cardiolipin synthase